MKKLVLFITAVALGTLGSQASKMDEAMTLATGHGYGNSFIFVENGVTFSVYPDGEFDFYMDNRVNVGVGAQIGNVGITFNSGYNYNPYVQYDDYGAVIQVENIPIYYDYYGRVSQIGSVDIYYDRGRVRRIGGMHVYYNGVVFSHFTGFINIYNRHYVYRPFHRYFLRPSIAIVYTTPYRRYYRPVRYTYYAPYRNNHRKVYAAIGKEYRYDKNRRAQIYRNDNRVAVRDDRALRRADSGRSNSRVATANNGRGSAVRNSSPTVNRQATVNRTGGQATSRATQARTATNRTSANRTSVNRSSTNRSTPAVQGNSRTVTKKEVTTSPTSRTVSQKRVSSTPSGRNVTKSTTTYKRPEARSSSSRTAVSRSSSKGTVSRSSQSTVRKSSGNTVKRSSSARTSSSRSSRGN